jgi:hypothetical protein
METVIQYMQVINIKLRFIYIYAHTHTHIHPLVCELCDTHKYTEGKTSNLLMLK